METEQLRVIAEGMGYKTHKASSEPLIVYIFKNPSARLPSYYRYDPENNPIQLLEIIKKLKIGILPYGDDCQAIARNGTEWGQWETLEEAVLQAALEVFKNN